MLILPLDPALQAQESIDEEIDDYDLGEAHSGNSNPGQTFAKAQAGLTRFAKPKLELEGAGFDQIAIAQDGFLHRLRINGGQSVRLGAEHETVRGNKIELEVLIPDAGFFNLQIATGGASDAYRKMAGHPRGTRLFPGQNIELNHYKGLFRTSIRSLGKISMFSSGRFFAFLASTMIFCPLSRVTITLPRRAYSVKSPAD